MPPESFEPTFAILLYIALVYVLSGVVKGVLGIGLPLVSIPLLAGTVGPITAMSLLAVPTVVINLWQTAQSGYMGGALKRFWAAYPLLIGGVIVGVAFLTSLDSKAVFVLVGAVVILIALAQLLPFNLTIPHRSERWATPAIGIVSGLLGGISSFLGPLMAMYLMALRVTKGGATVAQGSRLAASRSCSSSRAAAPSSARRTTTSPMSWAASRCPS